MPMAKSINRGIIRSNAAALLERVQDPDNQMPDPIGGKDIAAARHRVTNDHRTLDAITLSAFANPAGARWGERKHDGSVRPMVCLNPYLEWHLRIVTADAAEALAAGQSAYAHAGRFEVSSPSGNDVPVLRAVPFGKTHADYRDELKAIIRHRHRFGLVTDIRQFYPSLSPIVIDRELRRLNVPAAVSTNLVNAIRQVASDAGVTGLPIGMELSGLLANLVLHRVDDALERVPELEFTRWSDDVVMVDGSPRVVDLGFEQFETQLDALGLEPSNEKTLRNWQTGSSVEDLIRSRLPSQGDLKDPIGNGDLGRVEELLHEELLRHKPHPSRLRRLFGVLAGKMRSGGRLSQRILDRLLDDPTLWQLCVPRAAQYMSRVGTADNYREMVYVALDLASGDEATSEQIVHLLRVVADNQASMQSTFRRVDAMRLLELARASDCVPIRGWARRAAYELDQHAIQRQTINTGEFGDLHAFEQRWAIWFANPRQHHGWLKKQRKGGNWPMAVAWKLNRW